MASATEFLRTHQISEILHQHAQGDSNDYRLLCIIAKEYTKLQEVEILNLLINLRGVTGALTAQTSDLIAALLNVDWQLINDNILKEHVQFLISLAVGQVSSSEAVLKCLTKKFIPILLPNDTRQIAEIETVLSSSLQRNYTTAHTSLAAIIRISPMCQQKLLNILTECYPFMRRHAMQIRDYVRNLIQVSSYAIYIKTEIFRLIIEEILRLDVICSREIASASACPTQNTDIFHMEIDQPELTRVKTKSDELAEKLDLLLCDLFAFVDSKKTESLSMLYRYFLEIFERIVLPAYSCNHIQYVWFYICGINKSLSTHFLSWLWLKVQNPSTVDVLKQAALCYLASLLARAKFVTKGQCMNYVSYFINYAHSYVQNNEGFSGRETASRHAVFYSLCQSIFYIIVARHKEFIKTTKGYGFLKDLRLDKLITCTLNPLRYCTDEVVECFAAISRTYQFAFCYGIIERNRRCALYELFNNSSSLLYSNVERQRNILNWFYPFEPYFLCKSAAFIKNLYRHFANDCEEFRQQLENMNTNGQSRRTRNDSHKLGSLGDYDFLSAEDTGSLGRSAEKFLIPYTVSGNVEMNIRG